MNSDNMRYEVSDDFQWIDSDIIDDCREIVFGSSSRDSESWGMKLINS